jgi:glucose/arabinose dehydrogenase
MSSSSTPGRVKAPLEPQERNVRNALRLGLVLSVAAAAALARGQDANPQLRLEPAFPGMMFDRPTHVASALDGTGRLFVCEQEGTVWVIEPGKDGAQAKRSVYLDLTDRVRCEHNEEGLLSIAFHPKFKENGRLFVCYSHGKNYYRSDTKKTRVDPVASRVSGFVVKKFDAPSVKADTEQVIIEWGKPWGNHNGGQLAFGPDGYLYMGPGDGGAGGDPEGNGQRLDRLLAKILRIDVDKPANGLNYGIPADNPFVNVEGARPEVFAYGMRNPWRFSFDRKTGKLWAGDVGQDKWESIKVVAKGTNQGWNIFEGTHPFRNGTPRDPVQMPLYDYGRRDGASVTGGFVYHGKRFPALEGVYIFGDYVSGNVFGLRETTGKPEVWRLIDQSNHAPSSFGEDEDGEIYFVHHARVRGEIMRFQLAK